MLPGGTFQENMLVKQYVEHTKLKNSIFKREWDEF